jgi:hypothetical protein
MLNYNSKVSSAFLDNNIMAKKLLSSLNSEELYFRPYHNTNHLVWQMGHIGIIRNSIIRLAGGEFLPILENEKNLFGSGSKIIENNAYPKIELIIEAFEKRGEAIAELINKIDDQKLSETSPFNLPTKENTIGDHIHFFLMHEARHLGEMSLIKNIVLKNRDHL